MSQNKKNRETGFSVFLKLLMSFVLLSVLAGCSATRTTSKPADSSVSGTTTRQIQHEFAKKLEVSPSEITQINLYNYINDWLGVKHRLGGNSKSGIDCSAFAGNLYREIYQINLPRTSADMAKEIKPTKKHKLKEGDLVFFSFGKKRIDHVGIYLKNDRFVHVSSSKGVIISKLSDPWYEKYLVKYGYIN